MGAKVRKSDVADFPEKLAPTSSHGDRTACMNKLEPDRPYKSHSNFVLQNEGPVERTARPPSSYDIRDIDFFDIDHEQGISTTVDAFDLHNLDFAYSSIFRISIALVVLITPSNRSSSTTAMKLLTKEEEEAHYKQILTGGSIGGTIGLCVGVSGVFLASKRWPAFRGLTIPFRTFLVTSAGTFGAIINADRYGIAYQRAQDPMSTYKDSSARGRALMRENETAYERFLQYGREHRYSIVFLSWLASMGIALAIVGRSPMNTANKVVQARMYAQGLTLAVLVVSAVFEVNDAKAGSGRWETVLVVDPNDPEHKRLIEEKIHKEEYEGQDLWKDMVAAEEQRLAAKKQAQATASKV
ncbi:hypothetical protein G7046_g5863 [Stylonectria norvegica]|nr:hypothetical protein G7046_g5863 [Stylonectria norvegica]